MTPHYFISENPKLTWDFIEENPKIHWKHDMIALNQFTVMRENYFEDVLLLSIQKYLLSTLLKQIEIIH